MSRLDAIAKALDDGNAALARIGALQLGLPELADGAAVNRMAAADRLLKYNYNPDEPRDSHGRWTTAGEPQHESVIINGIRGTTANGVTTFTGGKASTYNLPGYMTSSGELFDQHSFTAAMRKPIALGTLAEVSYQRPGENITRSAVVRINDRGPYVGGRIIDLTPAVMRFLSGNESDLIPVTVRLPVSPE
jgi:rare lipoprotein A (peptidoglycan hydrolase)